MVKSDSPLGVRLPSCDQFVFMGSDIKSLSVLPRFYPLQDYKIMCVV